MWLHPKWVRLALPPTMYTSKLFPHHATSHSGEHRTFKLKSVSEGENKYKDYHKQSPKQESHDTYGPFNFTYNY